MHVKPMLITYTNHQNIYILRLLNGHLNITPSSGHLYIIAITNYFSKWFEVIALKEVKASYVVKFIKNHVVY